MSRRYDAAEDERQAARYEAACGKLGLNPSGTFDDQMATWMLARKAWHQRQKILTEPIDGHALLDEAVAIVTEIAQERRVSFAAALAELKRSSALAHRVLVERLNRYYEGREPP